MTDISYFYDSNLVSWAARAPVFPAGGFRACPNHGALDREMNPGVSDKVPVIL